MHFCTFFNFIRRKLHAAHNALRFADAGSRNRGIIVAAMFGLSLVYIIGPVVGKSLGFFADWEFSGQNIFAAHQLDIVLSNPGGMIEIEPEVTENITVTMTEANDEAVNPVTNITTTVIGDEELCDALDVIATKDSIELYDGAMTDLALTSMNGLGDVHFSVTFPLGAASLPVGIICVVQLDFDAEESGYTDTEAVVLAFERNGFEMFGAQEAREAREEREVDTEKNNDERIVPTVPVESAPSFDFEVAVEEEIATTTSTTTEDVIEESKEPTAAASTTEEVAKAPEEKSEEEIEEGEDSVQEEPGKEVVEETLEESEAPEDEDVQTPEQEEEEISSENAAEEGTSQEVEEITEE